MRADTTLMSHTGEASDLIQAAAARLETRAKAKAEKPAPVSKRAPKIDLNPLLTEGVWKALELALDECRLRGKEEAEAIAGLDLLNRYFDPLGVRRGRAA